MKVLLILSFLSDPFYLLGQIDSTNLIEPNRKTSTKAIANKGKLFFHWGYNRGWYTKSDIHFHGDGFDFTLFDAVGKDRQTPFNWFDYFAIQNLTIPQTNLKIGYFIEDKWAITFGVDHMKYVMQTARYNEIKGFIDIENPNDGIYNNEDKFLDGGFVLFEHTDGLNYMNIEIDRYTLLKSCTLLKGNLILENNTGLGIGFLMPKTNTTMFRTKHRDDFNLAGYGFNGKTGFKFSVGKFFYLQSEIKGGFINMPNIRISNNKNEGADQYFWFTQFNYLVGFSYKL